MNPLTLQIWKDVMSVHYPQSVVMSLWLIAESKHSSASEVIVLLKTPLRLVHFQAFPNIEVNPKKNQFKIRQHDILEEQGFNLPSETLLVYTAVILHYSRHI